jgi:DNA polymerase-3 subunit delta
LQKSAVVHPCDPIPSREAPQWVRREAEQVGKRISAEASQLLVELAGVGLRTLRLEVGKLAAYVGERSEITPADVEAVASRLSEAGAFALSDALGERNLGKAMTALRDILERDHPLPVLGMIAGHFRRLLEAKATGATRESDLARALSMHPYRARKILGQMNRYCLSEFPGIFEALEEADREIKSTGRPEMALETLVVRLCGPAPEARTPPPEPSRR